MSKYTMRVTSNTKKWRGYRLSAIDGTILEIPDTKSSKKEFGEVKNQATSVARAKASCIYGYREPYSYKMCY